MKMLILMGSLLLSSFASAQTINAYAGQTLQGTELINEHPTGNTCYVVVRQLINKSNKGNHCYDIEAQFAFNNNVISKDPVILMSKVTNYHRAEYPKIKSCASNVNGQTGGQDIYGANTEMLYTPFFSADAKIGGTQFDYFLTIDADSKMPTRARVHTLKWFSETNYDCVDLKSPNNYRPPMNGGHSHDDTKHGGGHEHQTQTPAEKPQGCDLWFAHHGICGTIQFLKGPVANQDSPFQILFTDLDLKPVDHPPVFVDLWMSMGNHGGHGTAPVTTTKIQDGIYRTENVFFVMQGAWQIRVTVGQGTHHAETDIFSVNIK